VPKGRRVAIPNGDGSGGIKKLHVLIGARVP
jgi:hypothetical protein